MNRVLSLSILAEIVCVFLSHHSPASEKKVQDSSTFFFSCANELETCGFVQQLILCMLKYLILQQRDFQPLNEDQPLERKMEFACR